MRSKTSVMNRATRAGIDRWNIKIYVDKWDSSIQYMNKWDKAAFRLVREGIFLDAVKNVTLSIYKYLKKNYQQRNEPNQW